MIAGLIIILIVETLMIGFYSKEKIDLEEKNRVLKTENKSLKRVMYENDLIPEEFVNND